MTTKGAISVGSNGRVKIYEDKPSLEPQRFNGFWCGFGFKKPAFKKAMAYMEQSTRNLKNKKICIESTPIFNSPIIKVEHFTDLGTWEVIKSQI